MNTTNSADDLKKQGLYFEYSPKPVDDAASAPDTPRPSTPPTIRPRPAQACGKCRERKTKVRIHPAFCQIAASLDTSAPARSPRACAARVAVFSVTILPGQVAGPGRERSHHPSRRNASECIQSSPQPSVQRSLSPPSSPWPTRPTHISRTPSRPKATRHGSKILSWMHRRPLTRASSKMPSSRLLRSPRVSL